jgi:hypothetical protein
MHSICLSNEPINDEAPCEHAKRLWRVWLEKRHGTIANLNARWAAKFASFADVPLMNPFVPWPEKPVVMDYVRFNQEFFADWHKMLADAVHEVAPGLPVHAKAMTWTLLNAGDIRYGIDATLFGRFSDINGNDAINFYNFGEGEFAQGWLQNAMGHALQRSVLDAPVFNSENHLIVDGETRYVPASHIRAALWQAAVYGQSATAIWVWERTFDPKSALAGSIMHRPACTEAVGVVNHDLNRAAMEITALQQAAPQVLLMQSVTALVWDGDAYGDCLSKLFTALSFTGLKPGFVTERQLEAGLVPEAPVIFVPAIQHFSDAALATLHKFKGRLVFVGKDDLMTHNEYGQARKLDLHGEKITFSRGVASAEDFWTHILAKLPSWNLRPEVELRGADQKPVWGVEWRIAKTAEGLVVNLCNYRKEPMSVSLARANRTLSARDVLSGSHITGPLTLQPLEARLLHLEHEPK